MCKAESWLISGKVSHSALPLISIKSLASWGRFASIMSTFFSFKTLYFFLYSFAPMGYLISYGGKITDLHLNLFPYFSLNFLFLFLFLLCPCPSKQHIYFVFATVKCLGTEVVFDYLKGPVYFRSIKFKSECISYLLLSNKFISKQ